MKTILSLFAVAAMLAGSASAEDKKSTAACCEKAKTAGTACTHKCCVEAEKKSEVCKKCNKE